MEPTTQFGEHSVVFNGLLQEGFGELLTQRILIDQLHGSRVVPQDGKLVYSLRIEFRRHDGNEPPVGELLRVQTKGEFPRFTENQRWNLHKKVVYDASCRWIGCEMRSELIGV